VKGERFSFELAEMHERGKRFFGWLAEVLASQNTCPARRRSVVTLRSLTE
jgi:hypothetical protein